MVNKIYKKKADQSIADAIKKAKSDGMISRWDYIMIVVAAADNKEVTDVEFRDLKRLLRTENPPENIRASIEGWLKDNYKRVQPPLYPHGNVESLDGSKLLGSGQCAALVQSSQPIGLASTWREGIKVRGNGNKIRKGTAIATFEDGFYPNRSTGNHVAYYISQTFGGIKVVEQWKSLSKVQTRELPFLGRKADGHYVNPSNNGDAFSVIMHKE